jgi:hypothetical protein
MAWVPGHAELRGNEDADEKTQLGDLMAQVEAAVDLPLAAAAIKAEARQVARVRFTEQ